MMPPAIRMACSLSCRWRRSAYAVGGSGFGLAAAPPQVGDVMDFGFSCVSQTQFPNTPTDITAEVVSVSNNAVIFEDTLSRGAFTTGEYDAIALNFDNVIDHLYQPRRKTLADEDLR